jgi:hypothetical protein
MLVERWRLPHLGNKGFEPSNPVRDSLALGDEVFEGVSRLPLAARPFEVLKRTEAILRSPGVREIYFDVTGIESAAKQYAIPASGFFARKELELVVVDLDLFRKTRFFEEGVPLWRNGARWFHILTFRRQRPFRLGLLSRKSQRAFLERLLEL